MIFSLKCRHSNYSLHSHPKAPLFFCKQISNQAQHQPPFASFCFCSPYPPTDMSTGYLQIHLSNYPICSSVSNNTFIVLWRVFDTTVYEWGFCFVRNHVFIMKEDGSRTAASVLRHTMHYSLNSLRGLHLQHLQLWPKDLHNGNLTFDRDVLIATMPAVLTVMTSHFNTSVKTEKQLIKHKHKHGECLVIYTTILQTVWLDLKKMLQLIRLLLTII